MYRLGTISNIKLLRGWGGGLKPVLQAPNLTLKTFRNTFYMIRPCSSFIHTDELYNKLLIIALLAHCTLCVSGYLTFNTWRVQLSVFINLFLILIPMLILLSLVIVKIQNLFINQPNKIISDSRIRKIVS